VILDLYSVKVGHRFVGKAEWHLFIFLVVSILYTVYSITAASFILVSRDTYELRVVLAHLPPLASKYINTYIHLYT